MVRTVQNARWPQNQVGYLVCLPGVVSLGWDGKLPPPAGHLLIPGYLDPSSYSPPSIPESKECVGGRNWGRKRLDFSPAWYSCTALNKLLNYKNGFLMETQGC